MPNTRVLFGLLILFLGIILLLQQFGAPINVDDFWPIFLLIPGLFLWGLYYTKRDNYGVLIPATILLVYSFYFFLNESTDYKYAGETSFLFTFGVALGLYAAYSASAAKPNGLKIASYILAAISAMTLLSTIGNGIWWPVVLIVIALFMLFKQDKSEKPNNQSNPDNTPPSEEAK